MEPIVSIILPTHNRKELLKKAITSVQSQSLKDWELIVVDDISSDGTVEMMELYEKEDERIQYHRLEKDKVFGITKYLNHGINIAKGRYIARLDDDDSWCHPDKLKIQVAYLDKNPECVLVGSGAILVNEKDEDLYKYYKNETDKKIRQYALFSNPFTHTTVLFRKDAALSVGGYKKMQYAEDWDLWLKLGKLGKLYNFKEHFTRYLSAGQNNSFLHLKSQSKTLFSIIRTYKDSYPNYRKALFVNYLQLLYTYLPVFSKRYFHTFMIFLKRKYF